MWWRELCNPENVHEPLEDDGPVQAFYGQIHCTVEVGREGIRAGERREHVELSLRQIQVLGLWHELIKIGSSVESKNRYAWRFVAPDQGIQQILVEAGFKKVTVLDEGLGYWKQKGHGVSAGMQP